MKIQKTYILIAFSLVFGFTGATASACINGNPCVDPTSPTGGTQPSIIVGYPTYQPALPQVYGNGGEVMVQNTQNVQVPQTIVVASNPRIVRPDYSYVSPIIFNQDGTATSQLTGQKVGGTSTTNNTTASSTTTQNDDSSILGGIFGNRKNLFSSGSNENSTVDQNMRATVESKGLALGANTNTCSSGNFDHIVLYKNITGQTISNVAIRVSLPDTVRPTNTGLGSYSERDNTLTYFIGNLAPNQEGQIFINGKYVKTDSVNSVARAELVYTLPDQNQNMIVSYAFNGECVSTGANALGASAIGGSNFFGGSLLGWLFLALFVSAFIYLIRFFLIKKDTAHAHAH